MSEYVFFDLNKENYYEDPSGQLLRRLLCCTTLTRFGKLALRPYRVSPHVVTSHLK